MPTKLLNRKGYGQVELNRCAFPRDGRVEAQCKLTSDVAHNGSFLGVLKSKGTCELLTKENAAKVAYMGLCYSAEHTQSAERSGLKDFINMQGDYPRIGMFSRGDLFTTNHVMYWDDEFTTEDLLFQADPTTLSVGVIKGVIVVYKTDGTHKTEASMIPYNFQVVKFTTMPDGQRALQFSAM